MHHGDGLYQLTRDGAFLEKLKKDYRAVELSRPDRAMLDYATKLTRAPWTVDESDVQSLHDAGFGDADILDIEQVVAYFAYVNRIADRLGVRVEPEKRDEIRKATGAD